MTTANLAVNDNQTVIQYTSTGEQSFTFPWLIRSTADIKVSVDAADQALGTDYTVSGVDEPSGGTVTFTAATTAGEIITIWLDLPIQRLTGFSAGASVILPTALNNEFIQQTRTSQMLERDIARALRLPIDDTVSGTSMELPLAASRAGKYLRFADPSGAPEMADLVESSVTLSQSVIAGYLSPDIGDETTAGVTVTARQYDVCNVLRYGADPTGATDSTTAIQAAIDVAILGNRAVVIPEGTYLVNSQLVVTHPSADTRAKIDWQQARGAVINSQVTGSVADYDTAGFALLIDGMTDSNWYGLSIDFTNGTAGVVMRCRNENCYRNNFYGPKVIGGATASVRETRTKVNWRIIGNEASAGATTYNTYFNQFHGPHFTIGFTLFDLLEGDGGASTQQPNAPMFFGPRFENYVVAISALNVDELQVIGAWWQLAAGIAHGTGITSITQSSGTATVTHTAHGYSTDDIVTIAGANESAYNGAKRITVTGNDTYTFSIASGTASPATGTLTATLNTVGIKGQSAFSRFSGIIDAAAGSLPYYLFDGSGATSIDIVENTAVAGIFEDPTDNILSFNNARINGLARINDRAHDSDGDANLDIFGTGSAAQSGAGESKVRVWGKEGSTRNLEYGVDVDNTLAFLRAMVAGTDLALGAGGETVILLDDSLDQAVIPTGKYLGFTDTQSTVGSAGGASGLPAAPTGYLPVRVGGAVRVIPFYDAS